MKCFLTANRIVGARAIRRLRLALSVLWAVAGTTPAPAWDTPVTPKASPEAQALLAYLADIYGKKILSGQQDGSASGGQTEFDFLKTTTGKLPAIRGFDFGPYTPPTERLSSHSTEPGKSRWTATQRAMDWCLKSNGIVAFCWHWHAPLGPGAIYTKDTAFDIRRGLTEGTPEHAAILRDLDIVAGELKKLRDARVPVLWRPLHEANGRWFWWGAEGRPEPFKQLWRLMFDRFVNYHKLNNLLWVFSPGAAVDLAAWYPGDEYVDIIGQDHYPMDGNDGAAKDVFDQLVALGHDNKLVGLSENGPIPDPDRLVSDKAGWLLFITWSGRTLTRLNSNERLIKAYNHPYVLSLSDLPELKRYPFNAAGKAVKLGFPSPPGDLAVSQIGRQPVTVAVEDAQGRTVRAGDFKIKLSLGTNPGGGALRGTLTATTINGIATFPDLRIDKPTGCCTLTASARGLAEATSPPFRVGPGNGLLREWWTGITARQTSELTNASGFGARLEGSELLGAALEVPYSLRTNFAERIRGCLSPPLSGSYIFEIVNDGTSELWLSPDRTPIKKVKIAEITGRTPYSKWPHSHEAWSAEIALEAGKRYYIEALHLQHSGGAGLSVSWRLPNGLMQKPIPAAHLLSPDAEGLALHATQPNAGGPSQ